MKNLFKISLFTICFGCIFNAEAQTEVQFYTTKGNFTIVLTDSLTPRTVDSFIVRAAQKFYDGLIFHRVINNFVIQGGDPQGTGMGGPGYQIPNEISPSLKNNKGSLAMANAGPNTNGSQFYVNLVNNNMLDGSYTVFGMTTSGFDIVQAIGSVPTGPGDKPITDVRMDSIRVMKFYTAAKTIEGKLQASISPNPSRGKFTIELPKVKTKIEVVDMGGQVIYTDEAKRSIDIDLSDKPKGIFIVRLSNKQGRAEQRIVVQ